MRYLPGVAKLIAWVSILFWPVIILAVVELALGHIPPVLLLLCGTWAFYNWYSMHRVIRQAIRSTKPTRRRRRARR